MNAQIVPEVYLDMKILLERKIENHDCCILSVLSTNHHSCSIGSTNLLSSPFEYSVKSKFWLLAAFFLDESNFRKGDKIFLINIFL